MRYKEHVYYKESDLQKVLKHFLIIITAVSAVPPVAFAGPYFC